MHTETNFSTAAHVEAQPALIEIYDRYGDSVIESCGEIDALEVHGVRSLAGSDAVSIDDADPEFFSVYVHIVDEGAACVGDFSYHVKARDYAIELGQRFGWPVRDFVLPRLS